MPPKIIIPKELLEDLYVKKHISARQIAKQLGCCSDVVRRNVKTYNFWQPTYEDISGKRFGHWLVLKFAFIRKGKTYFECKCDCGNICVTTSVHLKRGNSTKCKQCSGTALTPINIGNVFGMWTVIRLVKNKHIKYLCKCKCGKEQLIYSNSLKYKKTEQCRACLVRKEHFQYGFSDSMVSQWKQTAQKRNIKFNLTKLDIYNILKQQNYKCKLTGIKLKFDITKGSKNTGSLDRIDYKNPYEIQNIQLVHKYVNISKHILSNKEYIDLCKKVTLYNKIHDNINNLNIPQITQSYINNKKRQAISRNKKWNLTLEQLQQKLIEQTGKCIYTGDSLTFDPDNTKNTNLSIDRIDSNQGYTIDNIQLVTKQINFAKHIQSNNKFKQLCKIVYKYSLKNVIII